MTSRLAVATVAVGSAILLASCGGPADEPTGLSTDGASPTATEPSDSSTGAASPAPARDPSRETQVVAPDGVTPEHAMVIDDPQVDRNPKVDALGASTFVGLPTWFWVENAERALGIDGTKFIRAQVDGTNVWAEVTAQTDGLRISSPAGDVSCSSERATTPWAPGTPEAAGCSLGFRRASVGHASGFPVEASTARTATWSGSDGTVGAALPGTTRQTPFNVPVAESQAIVSRTR